MVSDAAATKAPIAKVADKVSGIFVPAVICIALATIVIWLFAGESVGFALARGISVLVISCPCALGLARIRKLTPIQMPHVDMDEVRNGRKAFTKEEWMDILLRSTGLEPESFSERAKWLLIARMIPLVENNFNLCELGPRSTGKSYIYEQISPNSILVAERTTTVEILLYQRNHTCNQQPLCSLTETFRLPIQ